MIFCMVLMDLPNIQELRSAIPHGITIIKNKVYLVEIGHSFEIKYN